MHINYASQEDGEIELAAQKKSLIPEDSSDAFISEEAQIALDIYETTDTFIIEAPLAGVDADDLDVAISSDSLTIRGKRAKAEEVQDNQYLLQECYWGAFARHIVLPETVDPEKSEAAMRHGVLRIRLPKLQKSDKKKIKVTYE